MRALSLTLLFLISVAVQADGLTMNPDVVSGIERAIAGGKVRAAVVGLYDNGKTKVTGFGQMSRADDSVPQGNSIFEIGSISKVFTAILTQTQVNAGRLGWDDTIASRLPDAEFASEVVGAITLRELSSHTSGLPRMPDNFAPEDPLDPYNGYGREHMLAFLTALDSDDLEKKFSYSNLGAGLLGTIAAEAAGAEYAEAIYENVLAPLGMIDSGTSVSEENTSRLAHGFSEGADMPNWSGFDALAGAGAILSSADEMLTFIQQNLHGESLRDALDPIRESQAAGDTGLGWIINKSGDDPVYWHNGGTGGYASFVSISPVAGTGVVILTASTDYGTVTELGFAQVSGEVADKSVVDLEPYPGTYQVAPGFALTVYADGDQLSARATGQGAFPLTPVGDNEFVFPPADIKVVFELNDKGNANKLVLHQGGAVTPAPRVGEAVAPVVRTEVEVSESTLQDYVGEYQLTPAAVLTVVVRDGQIFAQLTGQAAYPVFAYETDKFFFKVVDAQLHFERDDDGVIAVALHQGGVQRAPRIK